jgi:hypothetical protein
VPGGQPGAYEQAELVGIRQIEVGRAGQPVVDAGEFLRGNAESAILDLEKVSVAEEPGIEATDAVIAAADSKPGPFRKIKIFYPERTVPTLFP